MVGRDDVTKYRHATTQGKKERGGYYKQRKASAKNPSNVAPYAKKPKNVVATKTGRHRKKVKKRQHLSDEAKFLGFIAGGFLIFYLWTLIRPSEEKTMKRRLEKQTAKEKTFKLRLEESFIPHGGGAASEDMGNIVLDYLGPSRLLYRGPVVRSWKEDIEERSDSKNDDLTASIQDALKMAKILSGNEIVIATAYLLEAHIFAQIASVGGKRYSRAFV